MCMFSMVVGKKRCVGNAHQTLKVLSDLLGHENQEVSIVIKKNDIYMIYFYSIMNAYSTLIFQLIDPSIC